MAEPRAPGDPAAEPVWRRAANFLVILLGSASAGLSFGVIGPVLRPMSAALGDLRLS
jgi:hypothetical protein